MNKDLEGVVELNGKWVVLEDIQNPKLARELHSRLRDSSFNFFGGGGYSESNNARDNTPHSDHTDRHDDNYSESHTDYHNDSDPSWGETVTHSDHHTDKDVNRGYSEHSDHY
jgi:hypothetical protein